jgi:hypothetical protein
VTRKHHPDSLAEPALDYRSVLTPHFLENLEAFIDYATDHGHWLFDNHYLQYVHFTPEPMGRAPGVGVPAGDRNAAHALDSALVADADGDAHVFAVERATVEAQLKAGEFEPLGRCEKPGCTNLRTPSDAICAVHTGLARHVRDPHAR